MGAEGWCLGPELCEGKHHSAKEAQYTLQRVLPRATALTTAPLLVRMDSGFDSHALICEVLKASAARPAAGGAALDLLVKWNPRRQAAKAIERARARTDLAYVDCREGKRQAC